MHSFVLFHNCIVQYSAVTCNSIIEDLFAVFKGLHIAELRHSSYGSHHCLKILFSAALARLFDKMRSGPVMSIYIIPVMKTAAISTGRIYTK